MSPLRGWGGIPAERCWGHPRMPPGRQSVHRGWAAPTVCPDGGKKPAGEWVGAFLSHPSQCWKRRSPYKQGVRTTSPGRLCGRAGTVQSQQGGFAPRWVQRGGGRMSRALFVVSPLWAGTFFSPLDLWCPPVELQRAWVSRALAGRSRHPVFWPPMFGWSRLLLTETKRWQPRGACVGAASPPNFTV